MRMVGAMGCDDILHSEPQMMASYAFHSVADSNLSFGSKSWFWLLSNILQKNLSGKDILLNHSRIAKELCSINVLQIPCKVRAPFTRWKGEDCPANPICIMHSICWTMLYFLWTLLVLLFLYYNMCQYQPNDNCPFVSVQVLAEKY